MGLDVYVGPLTRYYSGDWENVAERAQRTRMARPRSAAGPAGAGSQDHERARLAVLAWRGALSASLGTSTSVTAPLDWEESDTAPYYTGRPGWNGFGSLVLWAAYAEHPALRVPTTLPEEWDNDPALVRSNAEGFRSRYSHLVRNVELWLPVAFEITFEGEGADRRRIVVGSSATLACQLAALNAATWKAQPAEVVTWARREPDGEAALELRARYAFAVMADLAAKAVDQRLPMKLDF
jgi:hypothetical protein